MAAHVHQITVRLEHGQTRAVPYGTRTGDLLESPEDEHGRHYLGALVNNQVVTLDFLLEVDSDIRFLTFADPLGWRMYRSTACFMLAMTIQRLLPDTRFSIEHSLGTGFYCYIEQNGQEEAAPDLVATIEEGMRDLASKNLPIHRRKALYAWALRHFEEQGQHDKVNLLKFRNPPKIVTYDCDGFIDLSYGPLAISTGALTHVSLIPHPPGFVIQFPDRSVPPRVPPLHPQPLLFQVFSEHKRWGRILNVNTVGRLNEIVARKESGDFIRISEALHEKKIAQIADTVASRKKDIQYLLVAGPSSSGKTTFSKRLSVQLRVNGIHPVSISVDNYFVDRESTPRDSNGDYDFEHIEAIDLTLFNDHLKKLSEGKEVELPRFDFENGRQVFKGDSLKLDSSQIVILEGIHCLNPLLTEAIPPDRKLKIYISALTQLNLDASNRISTTDNRLVRRLVRDYQFRGHSALRTMTMWPSVRRGEKKWIFPFQQEADIAFNSALDYELAVLRPYADILLAEVKPFHPQYAEARRLQDFLDLFLPIPVDHVPGTSILREFTGQSGFEY